MKLIFLGDVVGEPGRDTVRAAIPLLRERYQPDFFVVNGENSAGGNGITPRLAVDLMRAGADVITLGDHTWDQREIGPYFATEPRLLRPLNFPPGTPGSGSVVVGGNGQKLGVINLLGRTFMGPQVDNPLIFMPRRPPKRSPSDAPLTALPRLSSAPTRTSRPPTTRFFPAARPISPMLDFAGRTNRSLGATSAACCKNIARCCLTNFTSRAKVSRPTAFSSKRTRRADARSASNGFRKK